MFQTSRNFTDVELQFGDEKVKEMLEAGILRKLPTTNPHALNITLPLKRDPQGRWPDKRFCWD